MNMHVGMGRIEVTEGGHVPDDADLTLPARQTQHLGRAGSRISANSALWALVPDPNDHQFLPPGGFGASPPPSRSPSPADGPPSAVAMHQRPTAAHDRGHLWSRSVGVEATWHGPHRLIAWPEQGNATRRSRHVRVRADGRPHRSTAAGERDRRRKSGRRNRRRSRRLAGRQSTIRSTIAGKARRAHEDDRVVKIETTPPQAVKGPDPAGTDRPPVSCERAAVDLLVCAVELALIEIVTGEHGDPPDRGGARGAR